ncbi:MAG: hypothetical protein PHI23_04815, partial [Candidatus Peribacteraceae bacterium]|nr:hypothetical protein [Candidatus Peribacteraceae bacterium]
MHMQSFLHRPLSRILIATVSAALFSLGNASAAALLKVNIDPGNFDEMKVEVNKVQGDLSNAQCGGWNFEQSLKDVRIDGGDKGAVPRVTGAPGRKGIVFDGGDTVIPQVLESGMSLREENTGAKKNGFAFPNKEQASGWSTVCNVRECEGSFPYINELPNQIPCKNRGECRDMCPELNLWQKNHMICTATWTEWEWQLVGWDEEGNEIWDWVPVERTDTRDETSPCYNIEHVDENGIPWDLCHPGDSWKPLDQRMQEERPDANVSCELNEMRYCCSESIVNDRNEDPSRNCLPCQGDGLEVGGGGGDYNGDGIGDLYQTGCRKGKNATENEGNGREYFSYFREYKATYERNKVQSGSDDNRRENLPLLCFGRYDERLEFDPKIRRLKPPDRHCAIDAFSDAAQRFDRMKETQKIKGEYGANSNFPDPAYPAESRDTVNDIWHTDLGGAFSLLNGEKAKKKFGKDLPLTLLSLDTADQRATPQMTKEQPLSEGSLIRATDDTVANDRPGRRTIVEWWQEEESQMHKLFTPPTVRLILRSPGSEDLDISQPLLTPDIPTRAEEEEWKDMYP